MLTLPIGILLLVAALVSSTPMHSWGSYFNAHSFIIVVGGTIAILCLATPWQVLRMMLKDLRDLFGSAPEIGDHAAELEQLAETRRLSAPSKDNLINYSVELWDNGTSADMFHVLVSQRKDKLEAVSGEAAQAMRNLAKYPPALGMTGTVMGMVTLFVNLTAENRGAIGPALGLAMTATFFGLILANGVVMPLADRLHVAQMRRRAHMQCIYELLLLINRREPVTLIRGEVKERAAEAA